MSADDLTKCIENDPVTDPCEGKTCSNKGICAVKNDNSPICICETGYHVASDDLTKCIENAPVTNPCEGQTCSNHGVCMIKGDGSNEAVCMCDSGYVVDGLQCIKCTGDNNHNYMCDNLETAADQGKDCSTTHNAGCSDFCDSFIDYHCSTKCTSDKQCINEDYFCRSDGRCAPKVFETVWQTWSDNQTIAFPGGEGQCHYSIDWGDGTPIESYDSCSNVRKHKYVKAGTYHVKTTGTLEGWTCDIAFERDEEECNELCSNVEQPFEKEMCLSQCQHGQACQDVLMEHTNLIEVKSFGPVELGRHTFSSLYQFAAVSNIDIPNSVYLTNMESMFDNCESFNGNLGRWDTSNVTDMSGAFFNANSFNGAIGVWDTSKVTNMTMMFQGAQSFNQPLNHWNTSNVIKMFAMFTGATSFNQPLNEWNTSKVTDMYMMFMNATSFNQSLASWDVSKVSSYQWMFRNSALSESNWNQMVSTNSGWASMNASSLFNP